MPLNRLSQGLENIFTFSEYISNVIVTSIKYYRIFEYTITQTQKAMTTYYPEMNQAKPEGQIEAQMSYKGASEWYLRTALELSGRGVSFIGTTEKGQKKYRVTGAAFNKIEKQYSVVCALNL